MLTIIKGDDSTLPVTFTDENNTAIDLTGSTVFFTVKSVLADVDASAVIQKDIVSHTDAVNGATEIVLSNADTDITPGVYHWDLQIKSAGGKITSTLSDKLEIIDGVTIRTS